MRRVVVAALLVALAACGREEPRLAAPEVTATTRRATLATTPTSMAQDAGPDVADTRVPPDANAPASGGCDDASDGFAFITLNPDVPSPRCVVVHASDRLKITNNFGGKVVVDDGGSGFVIAIAAGSTDEETQPVGCCWQPGVHRLRVSDDATGAQLYGGGGPEVWLRE